ncbi:MAG TPA: STAS/SEC14 domain-containing protein [Labilithrix sp.]|jgi:hypothetical protein|nr:STAS/SEC14 domain-containing protein [Labilithrix sp.]
MTNEIQIGEHSVCFESDTGFSVLRCRGKVDESEAIAINDAVIKNYLERVGRGQSFFCLVDVRHLTSVTPEARRAIANGGRMGERACVAVVGGSFAIRVLLNLILKAMLLASDQLVAVAVPEEDEARAWLAERRRAFLASR